MNIKKINCSTPWLYIYLKTLGEVSLKPVYTRITAKADNTAIKEKK